MKKILIIDDETDVCQFLQDFFSNKGFETLAAASGAAGVEMAEKLKPQIILLDYDMPRMNGLEALKRIRAKNEEVIIIMMTAHNEPWIIEETLRFQADHYILKPFTLDYLEKQIKDILSVSGSRRKNQA